LDTLRMKSSICDSFCHLEMNGKSYVTNTVQNDVNPIFNEDASFICEKDDFLEVNLFQTFALQYDLIGSCQIRVENIKDGINDQWVEIKMEGTHTANLHILFDKKYDDDSGMLSYYGKYSELLPLRVSCGDIILFNTDFVQGSVVKLLTRSEWDHIGLIIENPKNPKELLMVESIPDGVNIFELNERMDYYLNLSSIGIRRLEAVEKTQKFAQIMHDFCLEIEHRPYKTMSRAMEFVRALYGTNQAENLESIFCSELVAAAYKRAGLIDAQVLSNNILPKDFAEQSKKIQLKNGRLGKTKYFLPRRRIEALKNTKMFSEVMSKDVGINLPK